MTPERYRQIGELYHAALEEDAAERAAFLERACAGDEELRREVESLINSHEQADDFIAAPAFAVAAELLAGDEASALAGRAIARYRVLSLVGAGGMGRVYLAEDPALGRRVALKLLPDYFTNDKNQVQRFRQEARAASALNHPNILTVYEVGRADSTEFIATEYVEGETLRARMSRERLGVREALDVAAQIADALAAAHAAGIIHRDIKPENIMLRADGYVKVLDFGLAKLTENLAGVGAVESAHAAGSAIKTNPGMIMGTAAYMSPEQAAGRSSDHRSDIFSFGCVLYEMLAGRRAFHGGSSVETLNAILREQPPELSQLNKGVTPGLEQVVRRCLEKSPERRFHSAADLAFALKVASGHSGATAAAVAPAPRARAHNRERLVWVGVCALLLAAAAWLAYAHFSRAGAEPLAVRLALATPGEASLPARVTVSPDGLRVVFLATNAEGKRQLWLRPLDALDAQPLAGTEGAFNPFWSPDGRSVGYFAGGKLFRLDPGGGGRAQPLCDASGDGGGTWSTAGVILFNGNDGGLWTVPAQGGPPAPLTKPAPNEEAHRWPYFLPDGRHFVFLADAERSEDHNFRVGSLDSGETRVLFNALSRVAYAPPGYLLYARQGALVALPFDAASLKAAGEAVIVAEHVLDIGPNHEYDFSVSESGVLAYQAGSGDSRLTWLDRTGKALSTVGEPANYDDLALSPDKQRASVAIYDADGRNPDIWVFELARGTGSRLTFDPQSDFSAVWSPDGSRIAFGSNRAPGGHVNLYEKAASGAGDERLLWEAEGKKFVSGWSPDGQFILFTNDAAKSKRGIWVLPLSGDRQARALFQSSDYDQWGGRPSPGGHFLAYASNESGRPEVYVQPYPPTGDKWRVSKGGGASPSWRADGRELFYLALDGSLMSVEIKPGVRFEAGEPRQLFHANPKIVKGVPYAAAPDGQRFLVNVPVESNSSAPLTVVLNWTAGLKR